MKGLSKNTKKVLSVFLALVLLVSGTSLIRAFSANLDQDINQGLIEESLGQSTDLGTSGIMPLGMSLSTFAVGDIILTIDSPQKLYQSYTDLKTGQAPPDVAVVVGVQLKKAAITGGTVVVDFKSLDGYYGSPYFSYKGHDPLTSGSIFDTITDNGDGTVTVKIKDNQPQNSNENFTLLFKYDTAQYDGIPAPEAPMAEIKAEAFIGGGSAGVTGTIGVKSGSEDKRAVNQFPLSPNVAEADGTYKIYSDQLVNDRTQTSNSYYYTNKLDESYEHVSKVYLPAGTTLSMAGTQYTKTSSNVSVSAGEVGDLEAGQYDIYTWKWPTPANDATKWYYYNYGGNIASAFIQTDFSIKFPSPTQGAKYSVATVADFKLMGEDTQRQNIKKVTYVVDDTPRWDFKVAFYHATGGTQESFSGIKDGAETSAALYTGYDYSNSSSNKNQGTVDVTGVKHTLAHVEDYTKSGKLNFIYLTAYIGRDNSSVAWSQYDVYFDIVNATNGAKRDTNSNRIRIAPTDPSLSIRVGVDFKDVANLQPGEYIDKVYLIPMGTDGTQEGVLPKFNSMALGYGYGAWPGQKWPDGTDVGVMTNVPMVNYFEYNDKNGVATTSSKVPATPRYQAEGPLAEVTIAPTSSNWGAAGPLETVGFTITAQNSRNKGANDKWEAPVVVVAMPNGIHLTTKSGVVATDQSGNVIGPVDVEQVDETSGISHYKFKLPTTYSLDYEPSTAAFKIYFEAKMPAGITAGQYNLSALLTSADGSKFFMGRPVLHNNAAAIPYGETKANYGLAGIDNFSASPTQPKFTILNKTKVGAASLIQTDKMVADAGDVWTANRVAAADFDDNVRMKLIVNNDGNEPLSKIKIYDIIPYNGYEPEAGFKSTGSVSFTGITGLPAGATVYYYHGASAPALSDIGTIDTTAGDWNTTAAGAKAFYVDFGTNVILPGQPLDVIMNFQIPDSTQGQQTVYNRFSVYYTANNSPATAIGSSQGFSTHYYSINYSEGAYTDVTDIPANISGEFGTAVVKDVTISTQEPKKLYYKFKGWEVLDNTGAQVATYSPGETVTFKVATNFKELDLTPVFEKDSQYSYTIYFDKNGATEGTIVPDHIDVHPGDNITIPAYNTLKLPGKKPNDTAVSPFNTSPTASTGSFWNFAEKVPASSGNNDITLYLDWVIDPTAIVKLDFDTNDSSATVIVPSTKNVIIDQPVGNLPVLADKVLNTTSIYRHEGWATTKALADMGTKDFTKDSKISSNTTVYAVWKATQITVTLDPNTGVVGTVPSIAVAIGNTGAKTLPPADIRDNNNPQSDLHDPTAPKLTGYIFKGWSQTQNAPGASSADFTNNMLKDLTADTVLYAVWEIDNYKITLYGNGNDTGNNGTATAGDPSPMYITYGNPGNLSLPSATSTTLQKKGSTLLGWATSKAAADAENADFTESLNTITSDKKLWAVWQKESYQLSFDIGYAGGVDPASKSVNYMSTVTGLTSPTRSGNYFTGWLVAGVTPALDVTISEGMQYPFTASKQAVGQWKANSYTVKTYSNTDTAGGSIVETFTGKLHDSTVTPANAQRTNYVFKGWSTDKNATTETFAPGAAITLNDALAVAPATMLINNQEIKLYAIWADNQYDVVFNRNYDSSDTDIVSTINDVVHNAAVTAPSVTTRTGYTFLGWAKSKTATTQDFAPAASITINDSLAAAGSLTNGQQIDLYGVWQLNKYKVVFYRNHSSTDTVAIADMPNKNHFTTVTSPAVLARSGYKFLGWSLSSTSTVQDYAPGATITLDDNLAVAPAVLVNGQDIKFYAVWQLNEYTVVFNRNYDASDTDIISTLANVQHDSSITAPAVPVRPGYNFLGWAKTATATTQNFAPAASIVINDTISLAGGMLTDGDQIELYGVWQAKGFTVTFDKNTGDNEADPKTKPVVYDKKYGQLPNNVKKVGHKFGGWTTTKDDINTLVSENTDYKIDNNSTLFALWTINEYTVQFDANGGVLAPGTNNLLVKYDNAITTMPANPSRVGYNFMGWNSKPDGSGTVIDANTKVTENIVLHATWEVIKYNVTVNTYQYNYNEAKGQAVLVGTPKVVKVEHGLSYDANADITDNPEYNFVAGDSTSPLLVKNITADTQINLYYKHVKYTVSIDNTLDLDVNDKNPYKDNSIKSIDKFLEVANFKISSDKISKVKAVASTTKGSADIQSVDFENLDFSKVTSGYDQDVNLKITWTSGQVENLVTHVKISDKIAPKINQDPAQKYVLYLVDSKQAFDKLDEFTKLMIELSGVHVVTAPKTEAEFINLLSTLGINITDNYDSNITPALSYLNGTFKDINWKMGESFIVYLDAKDSSGNAAPQEAVIIKLSDKISTDGNGGGNGGGSGGGTGNGGNNVDKDNPSYNGGNGSGNGTGNGSSSGGSGSGNIPKTGGGNGKLSASEILGKGEGNVLDGLIPSSLLPKTGGIVGIVMSPIFIITALLLILVIVIAVKIASRKRNKKNSF